MDGSPDTEVRTPDPNRHAIRAAEARFRNIIEKNADGVIVVGRGGVIRFVNPAACDLLGRRAEDLVGEVFGIPIIPGETTEVDIPQGAGEPRMAEMRVVETEWEEEPAQLASLRDMTERKRMEEQLRRQAEELAEADRRKDEFLAMLAHELRNPLAPILNAMRILQLRGGDDPVLQRTRDMVERQVKHLARLVDDLLDVSRITRGKVQLRKVPIDFVELVARAVETARPLIESRQHRLSVRLPSHPLRFEADPTRLEQAVVNLLNNAAKYTDPGGLIALEVVRDEGDVVARVRDSGIGIAPEMLPRVFDLFAQADQSLDRSHGGLGIGLTLVKSLVQMHGGTVTVASAGLGRGSEFVVRLPAPADVLEAVPDPTTAPSRPIVRSARVLIVDDSTHSAQTLGMLLEAWGLEPRMAQSGPEALAAARDDHPDAILLDIGLPGMDGYCVARRLRERPEFKDTLLVAMTGYGREEDRRRSLEAGFDDHLVKPLDLDALQRLLADLGPRPR